MRKWLYTVRSGRASIPLVIGLGLVVLTGGMAVPAFLASMGVTAQMATAAMFMGGALLGSILITQKSRTGDMPGMASYPVQRSNKGTPIPKIYGTYRVAGNVLWMGENHPWVTKKKQSGGKGGMGGGGGGSVVTGQGNRRSFLLGVCEGPASILRIWKGKEEISISTATLFEGDGSTDTGIADLTGEDYCNYPNMCCAFFEEAEVNSGGALPNYTFEVLDLNSANNYPTHQEAAVPSDELNLTHSIAISDINDLQNMQSNLSGNYYLTQDIDASATSGWNGGLGFLPVGRFAGTLDGCGYTISNLYINRPNTDKVGLFGNVRDGQIANVVLEDVNISGGEYVGALVGNFQNYLSGSLKVVENCSSSGTVAGKHFVGGLFGGLTAYGWDEEKNVVLNCYSTATVSSNTADTSKTFGGFTGMADYTLVSNCYATGDVTSYGGTSGGFVGEQTNCTFEDCYATGDVTSTYDAYGTPILGGFVGRSLGRWTSPHLVPAIYTRCYASGIIVSDSAYDDTIGGFIGYLRNGVADAQTFTDCYAWGNISGAARVGGYYGGFFGYTENNDFTMVNCYSIGSIPSLYYYGGFFGYIDAAPYPTFTSCYWDKDTSGQTIRGQITDHSEPVVDITGKSTSQMKTTSTFSGWNFIDVWKMNSGAAIDINPAYVIKDLLTNTRYGAGIDEATFIDATSFAEIETYCIANSLLYSFAIDAQKPILDWIDFINSHFQGYLYMSEGLIHLGMFKQESSSFTINQDNLVVEEGENPPPPVSIKKRAYSETVNRIEISWKNRAKNYDTSVVIAQDEADQRVSGKIRKKTIQLIGITNATLAQKMAYAMLFDSIYI